jgi:hypothetical protein
MAIIFYSWQSDLPNSTNRAFIETALEKAAKSIRRDESIEVEPVIDRDTRNVPGAPDIADTILKKIDGADIFVGDVSIINLQKHSLLQSTMQRVFRIEQYFGPTANPNVLIELGYAMKALGPNKVILLMNSFFGGPELLPFDLKMKRIVSYYMPESSADHATERNRLASVLEQAIRDIFTNLDTILPDLSKEDNLIFKTLCDKVVESEGDSFGRETLVEMAKRFGDEKAFDESLRILTLKEYIAGTWTANGKVYSVRVTALGFDLYAKQHIKEYRAAIKAVINKIIENPNIASHQLRDATKHHHYLVKFILVNLSRQKLIELLGHEAGSHAVVGITWVSPELKRLR